MKLATLALITFLFSSFVHAGTFVGNGGEGVEVGAQLYLRDLYSYGVHLNPNFGNAADSYFDSVGTSFPFEIPRELLVQKLTDIEKIWPGVGVFFFEAMKSYNWSLVRDPLTQIPNPGDENDPVQLPKEAVVFQIANRFEMNIRIHEQAWARLDSANRVALLMHEVVYGFVRPHCTESRGCEQPAYIARELVALFFSNALKSGVPYVRLASVLQIPPTPQLPGFAHEKREWKIEVRDYKFRLRLNDSNHERRAKFARNACAKVRELEKEGAGQIGFSLLSEYERKPFVLEVSTYEVKSGNETRLQQMTGARLIPDPNDVVYHPFTSYRSCQSALAAQLQL